MASIRIKLRDETERKFRQAAMRRFGYGKGALSLAAEEAIGKWIASVEGAPAFEGNPVKAIEGLLADVDVDSVELQHLAKELWAGRVQDVLGRRERLPRGPAPEAEEGRV